MFGFTLIYNVVFQMISTKSPQLGFNMQHGVHGHGYSGVDYGLLSGGGLGHDCGGLLLLSDH
jgi:hypothetical protein